MSNLNKYYNCIIAVCFTLAVMMATALLVHSLQNAHNNAEKATHDNLIAEAIETENASLENIREIRRIVEEAVKNHSKKMDENRERLIELLKVLEERKLQNDQ